MKSVLILLIITANIMASGKFSENFLPVWERAAEYTLKVVEKMPEDNFDFRATKDVGSFRELTGHIAGNIFWLTSSKVKDEENPAEGIDWEKLSKDQIISHLKKAVSYVEETAKSIDEVELSDTLEFGGRAVNKERIFYLMRDHMTHHRAQLIIYLRLNKIEPPRYVGW